MDYNNMTMNDITKEYNKLTQKNIKGFNNKTIAIEKLNQARNLYGPKLKQTPPVNEAEKIYSPKQLEVELGLPSIVIRRKLRKLFPEMAKKGAWKITPQMIEVIKGEKDN